MSDLYKRRSFMAALVAVVMLGALTGFAQQYIPETGSPELTKKHRKKDQVKMDPNLPNVLIIGDSISIGYTEMVRAQLKGKANVIHNPGNAAGTTLGLATLQEWLGDTKWDVIHFNWGLHDLKHVTETGENSNNPNDPQQADLATYTANLKVLVKQLKATNAKLIFATTTPYPKGVKPCRLPEDAPKYNAAALKIMQTNNIEVNDLYSLALPKLKTLQRRRNVHFKPEGSKVLADQVAAMIQSALCIKRRGTGR
ncbi:MAG: SGNH/GDSL hydrolase family protein [Kiritimatiellae bacterium]|nr:SGNH/GDSL hydrolase family protein [Kiritimatiellia bacterium]